MQAIWWEVKVSKLCNMRCAYCYEFNELGDRRRISLDGWRRILESARWYQEDMTRRHPDRRVQTQFMWHGGEPTLLPLEYYEQVLELQREILGAENLNRYYRNHVPTNLLAPPPKLIEFFRRNRFNVAVSFDGIPGVRVDLNGRETEQRVAGNVERLIGDGWTLGFNTVLAAHNAPRLNEVYDYLSELPRRFPGGVYANVIPLHGTPTDDGTTRFSLDAGTIAESLFRLFERWIADPNPITLAPIQDHYLAVLRKLHGAPRHYFNRRTWGETTMIVNTDGGLYLFNDAYEPGKALGNIFEQPFEEILGSEAYERSLKRDEERAARLCGTCPYDGYCNREPLVNSHREHPGEHCAVGYPVQRRIEEWLVERGFDRPEALPRVPQREFVLAG